MIDTILYNNYKEIYTKYINNDRYSIIYNYNISICFII